MWNATNSCSPDWEANFTCEQFPATVGNLCQQRFLLMLIAALCSRPAAGRMDRAQVKAEWCSKLNFLTDLQFCPCVLSALLRERQKRGQLKSDCFHPFAETTKRLLFCVRNTSAHLYWRLNCLLDWLHIIVGWVLPDTAIYLYQGLGGWFDTLNTFAIFFFFS